MEHDRLVDELPESLAVAVRLHEAGHPDAVVATALGIPEQSVSIVLRVAGLKLDALVGAGPAAKPTGDAAGAGGASGARGPVRGGREGVARGRADG